MTIDVDIVQKDIEQTGQIYIKAIGELDQTWRALRLESDPHRRERLERRAELLTQAGRELAGRHELATRAAAALESDE